MKFLLTRVPCPRSLRQAVPVLCLFNNHFANPVPKMRGDFVNSLFAIIYNYLKIEIIKKCPLFPAKLIGDWPPDLCRQLFFNDGWRRQATAVSLGLVICPYAMMLFEFLLSTAYIPTNSLSCAWIYSDRMITTTPAVPDGFRMRLASSTNSPATSGPYPKEPTTFG